MSKIIHRPEKTTPFNSPPRLNPAGTSFMKGEREDSEHNVEFSWVITEESESVHYDKKYKSYLREMYEKREEKNKHETIGGYSNEKN